MKYKIGDKVRVVKKVIDSRNRWGWPCAKEHTIGAEFQIIDIDDDHYILNTYKYKYTSFGDFEENCSFNYHYHEEALSPVGGQQLYLF